MTRKHGVAAVALLALAVVSCGDAAGPSIVDTEWNGTISQGDAVEIKGINGDIIASPTSSTSVTVTVSKEGDDSDPAEVEIEVITHSGGVTICAVYPDVPGEPANECAPGDQGRMNTRDNDVEVTFWVSLPAGVDFVGRTVNGSVTGASLGSNASAITVNGDISITTSQLASGTSVNGSINTVIGLSDWDRDLAFTTVNGDISIQVPVGTNADVRLATVNGSITTDIPLTLVHPGDIRGTLGAGGRVLRITTVNGSVELDSGS
ncbi:hypothetical protein ACFL3B_01570 [Gemmatimonadota bacterium]